MSLWNVTLKSVRGNHTWRARVEADSKTSAMEKMGQYDNWLPIEAKLYVPRAVKVPASPMEAQDEMDKRYKNEANDCTVTALVRCLGIAYKDAHASFELHGRKHRDGCNTSRALPKVAELFGLRTIVLREWGTWSYGLSRRTRPTLRKFVSDNPVGKFYVTVHAHALCIVDGQIRNGYPISDLKRVDEAYTFEPMKPEQTLAGYYKHPATRMPA